MGKGKGKKKGNGGGNNLRERGFRVQGVGERRKEMGKASTCVSDGLSCGFFRRSDVIRSAAFADTEGGIE